MRVVLGVVVVVILAVLGFFVWIYSGGYNAAASQPGSGALAWVLDTAMRQSVRSAARGTEVPPLGDPVMVEEGGKAFAANCEQCHGGPGVEPRPWARTMYPTPPDLTIEARQWTSAELFWIAKNGLRHSAMPAWGKTMVDGELWPVVAFLGQLPAMEPARYQELTRPPPPPEPQPPEAEADADATAEDQIPPSEGEPPATDQPIGQPAGQPPPEQGQAAPAPAPPPAPPPGQAPLQLVPPSPTSPQ